MESRVPPSPRRAGREHESLVLAAGAQLDGIARGRAGAPRVLLLHGITGSRHYWDATIDRLSIDHEVIAVDLLGFGRSPKPPVTYDLDTHALALRSFLDARGLGDRPVRVIGHSLGALVALRCAALWPGSIPSAVLASVPSHANRREAHEAFLRGSANYRRLVGQASFGATLASWLRAGPLMGLRYAFAFSRLIAEDSRRWTLHSLTSTIEHCLLGHRVDPSSLAAIPRVLLVHGERDQVAPARRVRELARRAPGVALHVVPGTGHHPFRTHSRRCLDVAGRFLAERDDEPAA